MDPENTIGSTRPRHPPIAPPSRSWPPVLGLSAQQLVDFRNSVDSAESGYSSHLAAGYPPSTPTASSRVSITSFRWASVGRPHASTRPKIL